MSGSLAEITLTATVAILLVIRAKARQPRTSAQVAQKHRPECLIHASVHNSGCSGWKARGSGANNTDTFASTAHVHQGLLAMELAARDGDLKKAAQIFLEFESSGIQPPAQCYKLMIRASEQQGDTVAAARWRQRMETSRSLCCAEEGDTNERRVG